ncbi:hypothetical protein [Tropicibacter alexandrii]|uniref:hypothetical protein n=1 Tax=Tropicibacter alexandrii TaxID=2267683 RepID=UPI000EF4ED5A|nr:hypothetical protein [Tropicibacter alexandrii]
MAAEAALMMAVTTVSLLFPLIVVKFMVTRMLLRKRGEVAAHRGEEAGRLVIVATAVALICGAVLMLGPDAVSPEMMASAR